MHSTVLNGGPLVLIIAERVIRRKGIEGTRLLLKRRFGPVVASAPSPKPNEECHPVVVAATPLSLEKEAQELGRVQSLLRVPVAEQEEVEEVR